MADPVRGNLPGGDARARRSSIPRYSRSGRRAIVSDAARRSANAGAPRSSATRSGADLPDARGERGGQGWFANWLRVGASPAMGYELNRAFAETDLSEVTPAVRVPTLVLYRDTLPPTAEESPRRRRPDPASARDAACPGATTGASSSRSTIVDEARAARPPGRRAAAVPESVLTTLLFTDIVGSSRARDRGRRSRLAGPSGQAPRRRCGGSSPAFAGEERDTAGDGFFATFDGPARAIRCAQALVDAVRPLGLEMRAGVHTGECELHEGKVAGVALSIGARICAAAQAGEVLVSRTVKDLVAGSGIEFDERGFHDLEGIGQSELHAVTR